MYDGIKYYGSLNVMKEREETNPLFLCVIANTRTSNIPGITGAGASPELTDYTPAADVELVALGEPRCLGEIPKTVVGEEATPTPAVITKASLEIADIPILVADAGAAVKPSIPYIQINDKPGEDVRTGKAVSNPREIFEKGKILGKTLSKLTDHLIIGESTPAGTTTALGVLTALGYDAKRKVSGSTPENPHDLKQKVVEEGLKAAGFQTKDRAHDPFQAIQAVGDPMIPAVAGFTVGSEVPVTLAGGTQMAAVLAVIKKASIDFELDKICIATTIFVAEDETSDINYITRQIADTPIYAVDPGFEKSANQGLQNYLKGSVKEGVGAGGVMMAAILKGFSVDEIRKDIEELCKNIF